MKCSKVAIACVFIAMGNSSVTASAEPTATTNVSNAPSASAATVQPVSTEASVPPLTLPSSQETQPTTQTTQNQASAVAPVNAGVSASAPSNLPPILPALPTPDINVQKTNSVPSNNALSAPFSLNDTPAFNPMQALTVTGLLLLGFAFAGYALVRIKKGKQHTGQRTEKPMEVISSMPIGPKRQLLIVRVRDQEIVIASTEAGITMLTDITDKPQRPMLADMKPLKQLARQSQERMLESGTSVAETSNDNASVASQKSEFLLKALNNLKEKKSAKPSNTPAYAEPELDVKPEKKSSRTPALSPNKGGFNKFFTNAFEQEASRSVTKSPKQPREGEESVENVTKLIREKLKNMQPAGQS